MTTIFVVSDHHFGHEAIIKYCNRPFSSVEEMNEIIIQRHNEVVRPQDQVLFLGDVGIGSDLRTLECVSRMNGKKHLIPGNHDSVWPGHRNYAKHFRTWMKYFESISPFARRKIGKEDVLFSHLPYHGDHVGKDRYSQFRLRDEGLFLVHGHVHNEWLQVGNQYNVGVDVHDFYPTEINVIAKAISFLREAMGALDALDQVEKKTIKLELVHPASPGVEPAQENL